MERQIQYNGNDRYAPSYPNVLRHAPFLSVILGYTTSSPVIVRDTLRCSALLACERVPGLTEIAKSAARDRAVRCRIFMS